MRGRSPDWKPVLFALLTAVAAALWFWYMLEPGRRSVVAGPWTWWKTFLQQLFQ